MVYGKSTQTLSVRELEAQEEMRLEPEPSPIHSSSELETPYQMRRRVEREERVRLQVRSRLEISAHGSSRPTLGVPARLIYFMFVGIWLGFVWLALGVALCCSLIGLPLGILMLRHTGEAFTLW